MGCEYMVSQGGHTRSRADLIDSALPDWASLMTSRHLPRDGLLRPLSSSITGSSDLAGSQRAGSMHQVCVVHQTLPPFHGPDFGHMCQSKQKSHRWSTATSEQPSMLAANGSGHSSLSSPHPLPSATRVSAGESGYGTLFSTLSPSPSYTSAVPKLVRCHSSPLSPHPILKAIVRSQQELGRARHFVRRCRQEGLAHRGACTPNG